MSFSQDARLSVIATDASYRQNFTAADKSRSTQMSTINTIINIIVSVVSQSCLRAFPVDLWVRLTQTRTELIWLKIKDRELVYLRKEPYTLLFNIWVG